MAARDLALLPACLCRRPEYGTLDSRFEISYFRFWILTPSIFGGVHEDLDVLQRQAAVHVRGRPGRRASAPSLDAVGYRVRPGPRATSVGKPRGNGAEVRPDRPLPPGDGGLCWSVVPGLDAWRALQLGAERAGRRRPGGYQARARHRLPSCRGAVGRTPRDLAPLPAEGTRAAARTSRSAGTRRWRTSRPSRRGTQCSVVPEEGGEP